MMKVEKNCDLSEETKKRVQRMKDEFSCEPDLKVFENTEQYDQMIAQVNIPFASKCEHHEVNFVGEAHIVYIPGDYLVGLSKLGRVVEYYLNPSRATIQEKATQQIMRFLEKELKPRALMVVVEASHFCIGYRGVKKPSLTITSAVSGLFKSDYSLKQEFLQLLKK